MPRLVLLNGPPGIGKSTLAQMYIGERPLALNLDIDLVRGQLGRWMDDPPEAGRLARRLAVAMASEALRSGYDVIVPQFVARVEFIEQLGGVAARANASFHEVALMDAKDKALEGFHHRSATSSAAAHREAAARVEAGGDSEELARMYDRLVAVLQERPQTVVVRSTSGDPAATYERLVRALP